jgi:hypothetical protein
VHALQREGLRLDVDLESLLAVARHVAEFFGRPLPGRVYQAGAIAAVAPV